MRATNMAVDGILKTEAETSTITEVEIREILWAVYEKMENTG